MPIDYSKFDGVGDTDSEEEAKDEYHIGAVLKVAGLQGPEAACQVGGALWGIADSSRLQNVLAQYDLGLDKEAASAAILAEFFGR